MEPMNLRDLGKLFIIGFNGTSLDNSLKSMLEELNPAGVILFSRNIEDPHQVAELNHNIQKLGTPSGGFFIGVDQEGGRVRRLREPFTSFAPALEMVSGSDPDTAVKGFAQTTASEIALVGFNLDFTPVLDVLSHPDDLQSSVIGDRSYGFEPETVAHFGGIVIQEMRKNGIIPCGKHFPGHGGTLVDSHVDLPVDSRDLQSIASKDLIPFRRAVKLEVEMLMTAHVLYPALDPQMPATLSSSILDGLLRKRMGYRGIIITDDLDMGAVADRYSTEDCSLKSFLAGADILLICKHPEKAFAARDRIFRAVRDEEISPERVEESIKRIENLKGKYAESLNPCNQSKVREYFAI
jgi:beta-N-acetylhexosaminidase